MNHPKVYDAKGRVLSVGSPATYLNAMQVRIKRILVPFVWSIEIAGPGFTGVRVPVDRDGVTYRCKELLLITDDEKGDGDGTSS